MLRYLLDTNIVISALRRDPRLRTRLNDSAGRLAVSSVTVMELEYGIQRSADPARNRVATDSILALLAVLPLGQEAAVHGGEIRGELAKIGTPIGAYDVLIAGHARSAGLALVTNNTREFHRVPGLQVEDWINQDRNPSQTR